MHPVDLSRISASGAPSPSSHGSGLDDVESVGYIHVWGELWLDGIEASCYKTDVLLPRLLESNVVLDVQQIACGPKHAAVVTRQGDVFTWGEEFGGRLGHGSDSNVCRPQLVKMLTHSNIDYVACGEFHTCAISMFGDLFTWGDGVYNAGILGHGSSVGHWIPKRVSGPLEGLQVLSVACGTWHSALITSDGKLFTFGDGTYGALGHGDRRNSIYPREVQAFDGLQCIDVACGVWHTAAIIEVLRQEGVNNVSRRLFTWGDGSKNCLGHGDKDVHLIPECVSSLTEYDFNQVACGHFLTLGLTTSGHVFSMGSAAYGQLGNEQSDGRIPCMVQDKLVNEVVDEISCGAYHVALVTSKGEVFTWGRGSNGRLGHGDTEDRKTPTLVDALKDRHVKSIACGSNFSACICIDRWLSAINQSLCSGCRQAFGFTRKRHNCYNCGMVYCHACSSNKVLRAALAPTHDKLHRVCDTCFANLKPLENCHSPTVNLGNVATKSFTNGRERSGGYASTSKCLFLPLIESTETIKFRAARQVVDSDTSAVGSSLVTTLQQLKGISFAGSLSALQAAFAQGPTSTMPSTSESKPLSQSAVDANLTPSSTASSPTNVVDNLRKEIEVLNEEIIKLQVQVKDLKQRSGFKEIELESAINKAQEATFLAETKSARCNYAEDIIRSLVELVRDIIDGLASEVSENLIILRGRAKSLLKSRESYISDIAPLRLGNSQPDQRNGHFHALRCTENSGDHASSSISSLQPGNLQPGQPNGHFHALRCMENSGDHASSSISSLQLGNLEPGQPNGHFHALRCMENSGDHAASSNDSIRNGEEQLTEQFAPGVYITFFRLQDGTRIFKTVRFSKRRFNDQQAELWWRENKDRVYKRYNPRHDRGQPPAGDAPPMEDIMEPPPPPSQP